MISSDIEAGQCHNAMLRQAKDTESGFSTLPINMSAMLKTEAWRRLIRPIDKRVFEHRTVAEWVLGPAWPGLAFPDWATLYALLEKNIEYGEDCLKLLQQQGAPKPEAAARVFEVKRAKAKGDIAAKGTEVGRGRPNRSYNVTSKRGNRREYLARRLRQHEPAAFAAFERGDFKTVRAAALSVGLVKPTAIIRLDSPAAALKILLKHFTRRDLLKALEELDA